MLVNPEKTYNIIIESKNYHSYTAELDFDVNDDKVIKYSLEKKGKKVEQ